MRYSSPAWFILMLKLTVVCFILKNIPVFAYLQMDMIINYFHDIGFFLQLCSNEEKVCRSTCSASESGRKHQ